MIEKSEPYTPRPIKIMKMSQGSSRLYHYWLKKIKNKKQVFVPYMEIVITDDPTKARKEYVEMGIDADTMFKNWPRWAKVFGYKYGMCPMAEYLTTHRIMIPNYNKRIM